MTIKQESRHAILSKIIAEVSRVVIGKDEIKELLLIALLSQGHVLIEGLPGTAKTTVARTFARAIGGIVTMLLPNTGIATDWPADVYGEPYVLYLIKVTETGELDWVSSATDEADYFAAVISYGRNRVPGYRADMPIPTGDFNRLKDERLYKEGGSGSDIYNNPRIVQFTALTAAEYNLPRLQALTKIGRMGISEDEVGIIDPGSDDIIYEF